MSSIRLGVPLLLGALAVLFSASEARAQEKPELQPSRVELLETDIRKLLRDGELQKADGKEGVYFAFGRKIEERGKDLVLTDRLGDGGVVFRAGHVELNVGVYFKDGNFACYITVRVKLFVSGPFDLTHEVVDDSIRIQGANLGSDLKIKAAELGIAGIDIKALVSENCQELCSTLKSKLSASLPKALTSGDFPFRVEIEPGKVIVVRLAPGSLLDAIKVKEDIALPSTGPGWRLVGVGDYDGDGKPDMLWRRADGTGEPRVWIMDGTRAKSDLGLPATGPGWRLIGMADFDGDGKADLLWQRADGTGEPRVWIMDGDKVKADRSLPCPDAGWRLVGAADLDGDGKADLLWQRTNRTGEPRVWIMDGDKVKQDIALPTTDNRWRLIGAADMNKDGKADLLWQRADGTGEIRVWIMDGDKVNQDIALPTADKGWQLIGAADMNKDGKVDLLWRRADGTGEPRAWLMVSPEPAKRRSP